MNRPDKKQNPNRKQDLMAGRTSNRLALRRQAEAAEQIEQESAPAEVAAPDPEPTPKKPRKVAAKPSARKPPAAKADPRMRVRWCVYDAAMKQVALFAYNQRADAEAKLADLQTRSKAVHFLRLFKDAIPQAIPAPAAR